MKLCRFELRSEPGHARSGMVFSGKIYETDGANAVAVHEAETVRPLAPIPLAPSLRIFRTDLLPIGDGDEDPRFVYGNPGCLVGASQIVNFPSFTRRLSYEPYIAAVLVSGGYQVGLEEADELVLGITILNMLVAADLPPHLGRSHDLGAALGPVLTTPDELDDELLSQEFGRHYQLSTVTRVNGVEKNRGNTSELPFTFAQAISAASQSCTLREGDVFAIGPVVEISEPTLLEPEDEIAVAIEKLGTLSLKLSAES